MTIEENFPTKSIQPIAKVEAQRRQFYRPIYSIHKSWARRPGSTFRAIGLAHFLDEPLFNTNHPAESQFYRNHSFNGKIVLDPFCGGGTSLVELNRLGVKTIGIDLNPVAWLTTKKELDSFDVEKFNQETQELELNVGNRIKRLYQTNCPNCHSYEADIMYTFWVRTIKCPNCKSTEDLFKYYIIGKKQRKSTKTMVICPDCNNLFYSKEDLREETRCLECEREFIPIDGNCRRKIFHCTQCSTESRLVDMINKYPESLSMRQYAIEFYCTSCLKRDYKKITKFDLQQFVDANTTFQEKKDDLLYPKELLPEKGSNIQNLRNYGFKAFADLFNSRQLLSLSILLEEICRIKDDNLREYFIVAFSSCLEFHTVLNPYNYTMKQIVNVFNYQSFLVPLQFVENNVWGTTKGNGSFITYLEKIKRGKAYCKAPFEILLEEGQITKKLVEGDEIKTKLVSNFSELIVNPQDPDCLLISGSSLKMENYSIPNESVDLVITDPPYFDYIQYSELANFFYIWLRLGLKEIYPWFESSLIPSEEEIGLLKEEESFLIRLTNVFKECHRVLMKDSPLIFTFHHSSAKAWSLILISLKKSHFVLTAAFPVFSEFKARPVFGQNHDFVLVCRKYLQDDPKSEEKHRLSISKNIELRLANYLNNIKGKREEGNWETFFAEILPLLSSRFMSGNEEELTTSLVSVFQN
ncbi:MAG: DNA methyltransferase [Candidatus Hodarchaeales archaeon]